MIAAVNGVAIGGGHVLHVVCDVTIAAEHARFGQAGPRVGSFDAGFGSAYLARILGEMDSVRRQVGYEGDLPSFLDHLKTLRRKVVVAPHVVFVCRTVELVRRDVGAGHHRCIVNPVARHRHHISS